MRAQKNRVVEDLERRTVGRMVEGGKVGPWDSLVVGMEAVAAAVGCRKGSSLRMWAWLLLCGDQTAEVTLRLFVPRRRTGDH